MHGDGLSSIEITDSRSLAIIQKEPLHFALKLNAAVGNTEILCCLSNLCFAGLLRLLLEPQGLDRRASAAVPKCRYV